MRQGLRGVDIKAASRSRRVRVDDNVTIGISKRGVLSSAEVGLRRASAVMDRKNQLGGAGDLGGLVVVETDLLMWLRKFNQDNKGPLTPLGFVPKLPVTCWREFWAA